MIDQGELRRVLREHECELLDTWLTLSARGGYTAYTSTLSEAWRLGVQGITESFIHFAELAEHSPIDKRWPPMIEDATWAFAIGEARLHRDRGIPLADYVALLKFMRDGFVGLLERDPTTRENSRCHNLVTRFFDLSEVVLIREWTATDRPVDYERMAARVRDAVNEKNNLLTAFEATPAAAFIFDARGKVQHANRQGAVLAGLTDRAGATYYAQGILPVLVPELDPYVERFLKSAVEEDRFEDDISFARGPARRFRMGIRRLNDISGKSEGLVLTLDDITELARAQQILASERDRLVRQLEGLPVMVWATSKSCLRDYFSAEWLRFTGGGTDSEMHGGWSTGIHADDLELVRSTVSDAFARRRSFEIEYRLQRRDGEYRWLRDSGRPVETTDGVFAGFIGGAIDITDTREINDRLAHLASHDPLTGLPNRRSLESAVVELLQGADLCGRGNLLFIDIDDFKRVNDTHGHQAGDEVLVSVAICLSSAAPGSARVFRVCGDEFAMLLPEHDLGEALALAEELCSRMKNLRIPVASPPVSVSLSTGVTPLLGQNVDEALHSADRAMYVAKGRGGGCAVTAEGSAELTREQLLASVRDAVAHGTLRLEAQQVMRLASGVTEYHECFVRLSHGDRILRPSAFLPAARGVGLMPGVTRIVVSRAIRALADDELASCSVHLGAEDLLDEGLLLMIEHSLLEHGVDPARLRFEVGGARHLGIDGVSQWLSELRSFGCPLVLHRTASEPQASLLAKLGFGELKADGLMLKDAASQSHARTTLASIVSAAHESGALATACFVETQRELELAGELGFDCVQGNLVGAGRVLSA